MKYLFILTLIAFSTTLSAQQWLSTSDARRALDIQEDILRTKPAADLTKDLTDYDKVEILNSIKREVVRDYSAVLAHSPNIKATLDEYLSKDRLVNSYVVSEEMKSEIREYLMRYLSRPPAPKR